MARRLGRTSGSIFEKSFRILFGIGVILAALYQVVDSSSFYNIALSIQGHKVFQANRSLLSLIGRGQWESFETAAVSPDGNFIAGGGGTSSGRYDAKIVVWSIQNGKRIWEIVLPLQSQYLRSVIKLVWSPDSSKLLVGDNDGNLIVFDGISGRMEQSVNTGDYKPCIVGFTFDGRVIAANQTPRADGKNIQIWGWPKLSEVWSASIPCQKGDLSKNGKMLAFISSKNTDWSVGVLDIPTRRVNENLTRRSGQANGSDAIALNPDATQVVVGYHDGAIAIWDTRTGKAISGPHNAHRGLISAIAWSPDGSKIASTAFGDRDSPIKVRNLQTGNVASLWSRDNIANELQFTDQHTLLSTFDDEIVMWKLK